MCTVTLGRTNRSLLVTVNRDELRTREEELAPRVFRGSGSSPASWMAPLDGRAGGTWMAANNRGVVACLLNVWPAGSDPGKPARSVISRGQIIPELMIQGDLQHCRQWALTRLDPSPYQPFQLVVADLEEAFYATWRGAGSDALKASMRTVPNQEWTLFSSSSWKPDAVADWRKELLESWLDSGSPFQGSLPSLHLHRPRGEAAWGPLVQRRTVQTRSITQAEVSPGSARIDLRYWADPWNADGSGPSHHLWLPLQE